MSLTSPRRRILSPEEHAITLHGEGRGTVAVAQRLNGRWTEHTVPLSDLGYVTRQLAGKTDVYLSQNRFFGRRRAIAWLAQLNALFADLDYYSIESAISHLRPEHVLPLALERLDEHRIPAPSFAISTGRGIALVWMHSAVPRGALARWQACEREIYRALQDLGADAGALDAARVLRLVGTANGKSQTLVMPLTDVGQVWDFDVLADEILPLTRAELERLRAKRAKARARRGQLPDISRLAGFNFITLAEGRLTDLQRLRDHRFMGELPPGNRDEWMFFAAVNVAYLTSVDTLPRELAALGEQAAGWTERETRARMSAVQQRAKLAALGQRVTHQGRRVDPRYRLRNETIIDRLRITEAEMLGAGLRHLVSADIRRERERARSERRRRAAGAVDRQTYEANSLSRQRPWEAAGISRPTWHRHRKAWNALATARETSPTGCMVVNPPQVLWSAFSRITMPQQASAASVGHSADSFLGARLRRHLRSSSSSTCSGRPFLLSIGWPILAWRNGRRWAAEPHRRS
jgi:hypothetical protein